MLDKTVTKRLLSFMLIFAVITLILLEGCSGGDIQEDTPDIPESDKLSIVAAAFAPYDFCRQISGELADVTLLIGPGEEYHGYVPSENDKELILSSDIFVYSGGDAWTSDVTALADSTRTKLIDMSQLVPLLEVTAPDGMKDILASDDTARHTVYDEHVWTSIDNAQVISQAIADALCEADEENSSYYRSNCEVYLSELSALKRSIRRIVSDSQKNTVVVGGRNSMRYFADEFGLMCYTAYPDCTVPYREYDGAAEFLAEKASRNDIPVVFCDELSDGGIAQKIIDGTDKQAVCFYSCHNISMEDYIGGVTYTDLMKRNAEALELALSGDAAVDEGNEDSGDYDGGSDDYNDNNDYSYEYDYDYDYSNEYGYEEYGYADDYYAGYEE